MTITHHDMAEAHALFLQSATSRLVAEGKSEEEAQEIAKHVLSTPLPFALPTIVKLLAIHLRRDTKCAAGDKQRCLYNYVAHTLNAKGCSQVAQCRGCMGRSGNLTRWARLADCAA